MNDRISSVPDEVRLDSKKQINLEEKESIRENPFNIPKLVASG